MEIKKVETLEQLKELYNCSAMTWEGLREDDWEAACKCCSQSEENGTIYLTTGETMNKLCKLKDGNSYPEYLNIVSIKDYRGLAINYNARWMDDIIDNNARRGRFHPFR